MPAQQQETAVMERNSRFERAGREVHVPFFVAGPGAREDVPADGAAGAAPGDDAPRPMPAARTRPAPSAGAAAGAGPAGVAAARSPLRAPRPATK